MLAWAMPALTATVVWQWIFDTQYGLVNWALGRQGHSWLVEPALASSSWPRSSSSGWASRSSPSPVRRADPDPRGDRSRPPRSTAPAPWQRFRDIVVPALKPILLILTSLSVLWDFRVFTQIYVLQHAGGITRDTNLLGVYIYRISIGENQLRHRRRGRRS